MNVTREVILDLLPLYLADEASPATRALVEEYLKSDPELTRRVREQRGGGDSAAPPLSPPAELELQTLRRTLRLLRLQRWLFGLGIGATLSSLSVSVSFHGARPVEAHLLMRDFPLLFGPLLAFGVASLIAYFAIGRRLRVTRE